jgi:hypothetical protein
VALLDTAVHSAEDVAAYHTPPGLQLQQLLHLGFAGIQVQKLRAPSRRRGLLHCHLVFLVDTAQNAFVS